MSCMSQSSYTLNTSFKLHRPCVKTKTTALCVYLSYCTEACHIPVALYASSSVMHGAIYPPLEFIAPCHPLKTTAQRCSQPGSGQRGKSQAVYKMINRYGGRKCI